MRFEAWFLALLPLISGCGDKSAVTLTASITDAMVTVQDGALGASTSGDFTLVLSLGPEAPRAATVTLGNFALQSEQGTALIDPLPTDSGSASFPLDVNKGQNISLPFTLNVMKLLTPDQKQALCAGKVRIVGTVMDTLSGGTDSAQSVAVSPSCP